MKTRRLIAFIMLLMTFALVACMNAENEKGKDVAHEAWELRMNGMADSAYVILENALSEDSTNAMEWFEITRTLQHMGLSNPMELMQNYGRVGDCISNAVKYAPENAYFLSYKGSIESFGMYIKLQTGAENVAAELAEIEATYMDVLAIDPDYLECKLSLVELYSQLPSEMGGDSLKAEKYISELEAEDLLLGAKAREIVMLQDADYLSYWQGINEELPDNAGAIESLGKIYLFNDDLIEAENCYREAMELDPSKNVLLTDLGRYFMMQAMQNPQAIDSLAPLSEAAFNLYLQSSPEPPRSMKAWVYGNLAKFKFRTGDQEGGQALVDKATELDPFYSKAFGLPDQALFSPPDVVVRGKGFYFRPF